MILKILYALIGTFISAAIPLLMLFVAIKYADYQNKKDGKQS
jgi:predicted membrane-bound spermidine synthase